MTNITFYNHQVDQEIVDHQRAVFTLFGHKIYQKDCKDWKGHAGEIDEFLQTNRFDTVCIWDIDCIPLNPEILNEMHEKARQGKIFGVAQQASHILGSITYLSPACICFSYLTWLKLGRPSFQPTKRSDCGGEITHIAKEKGIEIEMLYPSDVTVIKWKLDKGKFGLGTTYDDKIYHAFLSRKGNKEMFINKCKSCYDIYS